MSLAILGFGTANPTNTMSLQEATELAIEVSCETERQKKLLKILYRKSGVKNRHTVIPHRDALRWASEGWASEGGNGDSITATAVRTSLGPTTQERMIMYEDFAPQLAAEAVAMSFKETGIDPQSITHLVTVSCTGFYAPGVDVDLIRSFELPPTTQRVHVGFMGCHGAINGLRVAQSVVEANPHARVLLCAVECCSLHFQYQWAPERFVGNSLFADGAAALVCASENGSSTSHSGNDSNNKPRSPLCVKGTGSCLIPDSTDAMGWRIGDHGFEMYLSAQVPDLIEKHLRPWLTQWLREQGTSLADIGSWAIHPGGPRILDAVESALDLTPDDTVVSRDVLANFGNMSSPTVLFILKKLRERQAPLPCVALGFGPGLIAEAALIV